MPLAKDLLADLPKYEWLSTLGLVDATYEFLLAFLLKTPNLKRLAVLVSKLLIFMIIFSN